MVDGGTKTTETSISITVAALNEEQNLAQAVDIIVGSVQRWFDSYEIVIFNDGSSDRTGEVAEELAAKYDGLTVVHHERSQCLGGVIRNGLARARMEHYMWIDGKGATTKQALDSIFALCGQYDLIVPYPNNQSERPLIRQLIARTFVTLLNTLFRLKLRYYTHVVLCRTQQVRQFRIRTDSYAYQAEMLIKMIKSGCSYTQVGVPDRYDLPGRRTKAFKFNNVIRMFTFLTMTIWDVYIARNSPRITPSGDQLQPVLRQEVVKERRHKYCTWRSKG